MKYFSVHVTQKVNEIGIVNRAKAYYMPFLQGMKALGKDAVQVWKNREVPTDQLTRRQAHLNRQILRDLYVAAPVVLVYVLPVVGIIGPLVALRYPKYLLPYQFWTPVQAEAFFSEDAKFQQQETRLLVESSQKQDDLHKMPWPQDIAPVFQDNRIEDLPIDYAKKLALACRLLPKWMAWNDYAVRKTLYSRSMDIIEDDKRLLDESVSDLSLVELQLACAERGIVADYGSKVGLQGALEKWLLLHQTLKAPSQLTVLHASAYFTVEA